MNRKKTQRLYREEGPVDAPATRAQASDRDARADPDGDRTERALVGGLHDQLVSGRRLRILNVVDGVTKECLAAVVDTSISG